MIRGTLIGTQPRPIGDCLPSPTYLEFAEPMELAHAIRQLCDGRGVALTRFGRDAVNDPCLVANLRNGRVLGTPIKRKVLDHFAALRTTEACHG